jgi:homeobox protein cut-like
LTPSAAEKERATDDDHSVATIVMAQRDRLRARCEALEAERDSFKRELQGQVGASESLKADNTKLYEKVRYLQNYNKGPSNRGAYNRTSGGDRDLDLEALEQRYEASVDPFRQFSKSERQRKLNDMSPMERTVFIVAKTVLCKCKKTSARRHISVEILNG